MTQVTPEDYYAVAAKLCELSKTLETALKDLDNKLDVSQSAGTYDSGGPVWATSFDQSASDVFEMASTTSMAARELGYLVHQAGLNHADVENESSGGPGTQPTPPQPQGSSLATNLHPTKHAVGGTREKPAHWDLIEKYVTKQWADCDEGRIGTAGTDFTTYGNTTKATAATLRSDVLGVFTQAAQDQSPEVDGIVDEVANVYQALSDTGDMGIALGAACQEVHRVADIDKRTGRTSLQILNAIVFSYEVDKIGARRIGAGWLVRLLDSLIEQNKRAYARGMDALIEGINGTVSTAAESNKGIYTTATTSTQLLSSILDRTPRQTNPVRNRSDEENRKAGEQGEERAGIPPHEKRRVPITYNGVPSLIEPDYIDDENQNVVEVKNTNEIRPYKTQILKELQFAQEEGYTMTLVVDHRTQINDPDIQKAIDSGQIQIIRKELDDNDDH
ncbi:putative toxin [Mycolicibacterium wolinskyi]|uniref:putative toxin n=1 Tax=Mycolicibacterium wolinskyi TaxID=59750 RepID=UPI0039176DEE